MDHIDKIDILQENLRVIGSRSDISAEQRELVLRDVARLTCLRINNTDLADVRALYISLISPAAATDELILYDEMLKLPTLADGVKRLIAIGNDDGTPAGTHGKIAYAKNKFSDTVLNLLADTMHSARPIPVASNTAACEAVINGKSEFCLLPIENTRDGKIFGFYSMLDRFELKICGVHTLDADDDMSSIKYALVSKSCKDFFLSRSRGTEYIFEFSVVSQNGDFIEPLLQVAKKCGATLVSVDSRPVEYDQQLRKYLFGFLNDGNLMLRMYPAFNYHGYTPIGLYQNNL